MSIHFISRNQHCIVIIVAGLFCVFSFRLVFIIKHHQSLSLSLSVRWRYRNNEMFCSSSSNAEIKVIVLIFLIFYIFYIVIAAAAVVVQKSMPSCSVFFRSSFSPCGYLSDLLALNTSHLFSSSAFFFLLILSCYSFLSPSSVSPSSSFFLLLSF